MGRRFSGPSFARMLQQAVAGTRTNFGGGRKEGASFCIVCLNFHTSKVRLAGNRMLFDNDFVSPLRRDSFDLPPIGHVSCP